VKTLTKGEHAFSFRNLEAAANNTPIVNNTVIEPLNSFMSINAKSKAEATIITIPTTNIVLLIFDLFGYPRLEKPLLMAH
jgi:hypothetical protein